MRKILVFNAGSSSIKFHLFSQSLEQLLIGSISKIGEESSLTKLKRSGSDPYESEERVENHTSAIHKIMDLLTEKKLLSKSELLFVGHRVVHGGDLFQENKAYRVDEDTLKRIESLDELAPLHNPVSVTEIKECLQLFEGIPQIIVFDSSYHCTIPVYAYRYALPKSVDQRIRKYGFHGISYNYIASVLSKEMKLVGHGSRFIVLHLGNGCSACAIKDGKSVDTSMGFTPLEGLVMGTRTGDIDPSVVFYMLRKKLANDGTVTENDITDVEKLMNSESGLKGLCGKNDMRSIVKTMKAGDKDATIAFDLFCYRVAQYVGSYFVTLEGCDGIVFTAGIGENSSDVREAVCQRLTGLGVKLDSSKNQQHSDQVRTISASDSAISVMVIPTCEEKQIATLGLEEV